MSSNTSNFVPPTVFFVNEKTDQVSINDHSTYEEVHCGIENIENQISKLQDDAWAGISYESIKHIEPFVSELQRISQENPDVEVVYADSFIKSKWSKKHLVQRPDFSPEMLRSINYLGPLVFYKANVLKNIFFSGYKSPVIFAFDIALQALKAKKQFHHIRVPKYIQIGAPKLYSSDEVEELKNLIQNFLDTTGGGEVLSVSLDGVVKSLRSVVGTPKVSIVIPSRGIYESDKNKRKSYLLNAIDSIVNKTDYPNYEVILVLDENADSELVSEAKAKLSKKLKIVDWAKPFNFSSKMNLGVLNADGEYILLLNDDVEVINSRWLTSMLSLCQLEHAGLVGAFLYYEDDTIQHAGHAYYLGSPTHIGLGIPRGDRGPNAIFEVEREVIGVTAACAMIAKEIFIEAGGFTSLLPGNFNDVDLCLKVNSLGYTNYWTPNSELYHFESKTRDAHVHYYELDVLNRRWGLKLDDSKYLRGSPSLSSGSSVH